MSAVSAISSPADLIKAPSVPQGALMSADEAAKRAQIKTAAQNFESSFLSIMFQEMFQGVETPKPFGGGQGEQMFQSFMTDAFAKQMAKGGGIGLADVVGREMLKLQGLE